MLFSLGWQSPRDGVIIKILVSISILAWHQEGEPVKILPHLTNQKDSSVEDSLNFYKIVLLDVTDWICGWRNAQPVLKKHIDAIMC